MNCVVQTGRSTHNLHLISIDDHVTRRTVAGGSEDAWIAEMRSLFEGRKAKLVYLPVDDEGVIGPMTSLKECDSCPRHRRAASALHGRPSLVARRTAFG